MHFPSLRIRAILILLAFAGTGSITQSSVLAQDGLEERPMLKMLMQRMKQRQQNAAGVTKNTPAALTGSAGNYDVPLTWLSEKPKSISAGDYGRRITCNGEERSYLIHVPKTYNSSKATPVVLVFHGGGGNPNQQRYDSKMDKVAEKHNFIAVYPFGSGPIKDKLLTWNGKICCGYALKKNVDDVGFVRNLLDDLATFANVDKKRVYATGLSNGAIMSYRVACQLSDRIAAIGPVAYQMSADAFGEPPPRAVSVIHFHGVYDTHAAYNGGKGKDAYVQGMNNPSVKDAITSWAKHDGCPDKPKVETKGNAESLSYGPGKDGAEVVLWTLKDGGHTWPGGRVTKGEERLNLGHINTDIDASELMWSFFQKHPL